MVAVTTKIDNVGVSLPLSHRTMFGFEMSHFIVR